MNIKMKCCVSLLIVMLLCGCSQRKNPSVDENVPWNLPNEMDWFLSESVWTYNEDQEIIFIRFGGNVRMVKTTGTDCLENLGNSSGLQRYYVSYHQIKKKGNASSYDYPYLQIGDQSYDFLEIKEDSFTLADFNDGEPCTFTKKESGAKKLNGKYLYNGKTYIIYYSSIEGSIIHEETGRSCKLTELDDKRIKIKESILSDIPVYRWWEDEEGNLYLLSEGYEVSGMGNEEIFEDIPIIKLEKID